ncbi:MAG: tetratricopeptide repeat protein [Myxococcaceae bacterium]|nr:tetratricopeptide repeat protein [Myxococcaceae bacterium]MBH2005973.1 tetratricopeptide repeat protein [Myxococcaceae bacterium]
MTPKTVQFRKRIQDAFLRVEEEQIILFVTLENWVHLLLVPKCYSYSAYEIKQIANEMKQNILPSKHPEHDFQVLEWQEIIDSNQWRHPPFEAWLSVQQTQAVFFVEKDKQLKAGEAIWLGIPIDSVEVKRNPVEDFIQMTLRSPTYFTKTHKPCGIKNEKFGWIVERYESDHWQSIEYGDFEEFRARAKQQTGRWHFEGMIYIHEDPSRFAAVCVGEQVASIAAFPDLVLGAIKVSNCKLKKVLLNAFCEDVLIVSDPGISKELLRELREKAEVLLSDIGTDGIDRLDYQSLCELPNFPCGHFQFQTIPAPYFDLVQAAEEAKVSLSPGRSDYLRGLSYELIQLWAKAAESFRASVRYNLNDGDINHALGRSLIEMARPCEAIPFLKKSQTLLPEDPDVMNGLGIAYLGIGEGYQAQEALEKAVGLCPEEAQFLANLGRCYLSNKQFKKAESILQQAIEVNPHFSDAHATLAQVCWRQGNLSRARKHARKAFATNPGSSYCQDLLWALTVDER